MDQCLVFEVTKGSVLEVRKNRILCILLSSDLADCVTDQRCIKFNSPGKADFSGAAPKGKRQNVFKNITADTF